MVHLLCICCRIGIWFAATDPRTFCLQQFSTDSKHYTIKPLVVVGFGFEEVVFCFGVDWEDRRRKTFTDIEYDHVHFAGRALWRRVTALICGAASPTST